MKNATEIIDALGGTRAVSKIVGVSDSAVSQWRDNGIPKGWLKFLQMHSPELFGLTRRELIRGKAKNPSPKSD